MQFTYPGFLLSEEETQGNMFCSLQAELTFSAGDIIHVFGDMDEDGFFFVSV